MCARPGGGHVGESAVDLGSREGAAKKIGSYPPDGARPTGGTLELHPMEEAMRHPIHCLGTPATGVGSRHTLSCGARC